MLLLRPRALRAKMLQKLCAQQLPAAKPQQRHCSYLQDRCPGSHPAARLMAGLHMPPTWPAVEGGCSYSRDDQLVCTCRRLAAAVEGAHPERKCGATALSMHRRSGALGCLL